MKKAQDKQREIERRFIRDAACVDSVCTAFEANYQADFYFSGEFHPFWEFVYVLSGSVGASGEDRIYRLNEGDIIFHKPMEFHRIWSGEGTEPQFNIISFTASGSELSKLENRVVKCSDSMNEFLQQAVGMNEDAFDHYNKWAVNGVKDAHLAFKCVSFFELALNEVCLCRDDIEPEKPGKGDDEQYGELGDGDVPGGDKNLGDGSGSGEPKTGDESNPVLWGALCLAALAGLVGMFKARKRS